MHSDVAAMYDEAEMMKAKLRSIINHWHIHTMFYCAEALKAVFY